MGHDYRAGCPATLPCGVDASMHVMLSGGQRSPTPVTAGVEIASLCLPVRLISGPEGRGSRTDPAGHQHGHGADAWPAR
jgi:hypothetical protein